MPTLEEIIKQGVWNGSGQVAKQIIVQRSHYGRQIRPYFIPTNPRTNKQQSWRTLFKSICDHWNKLPEQEKEVYNELAKRAYRTKYGFNLYAKFIFREWKKMIIKSVQQGFINAVQGINDITITAVDITKAVILVESYSFRIGDGLINTAVVYGGYLTTATNLRIRVIRGGNIANLIVPWQVVEYY